MNANSFGSLPFIQGHQSQKAEPLSRYLPPVSDGTITTWLTDNIAQGSWLVDPFCASPKIALEAARAGYRILATVNNPITRFILEMMADPPSVEDLKSALAALSASYIGNERIEPHIRALYQTTCARCGQIITADAFLWVHGNPSPYMRIYSCPNCGDSGEHPCTAFDVENASRFSVTGMHKARALERVIASTDQDRVHVEQALLVYSPRALYGLITIINKLSGLDISPLGKRNLSALLLSSFDQANAMWKVSSQKEKPRQLGVPRAYRENNIWLALEESINLWSRKQDESQVPLSYWPNLPPPTGGICLFEGRFISIADSLNELDIASIVTSLPRPNQAYWTLSALWAGWLWGREAIAHYKSVLHRQRFDWAWHTNALSSVFKQLVISLKQSIPVFAIISDAEPGFIGASLISACLAGCHLENVAIRLEEEQAQVIWTASRVPNIFQPRSEIYNAAINTATNYLEQRAEPANYLMSISAALIGALNLLQSNASIGLSDKKNEITTTNHEDKDTPASELFPSGIYTTIFNTAREALSYRCGFIQFSLQDTTDVELSEKFQGSQDTLFSLDTRVDNGRPADEEVPENSSEENKAIQEKEKSSHTPDIPISTLFWLRESITKNIIPFTDRCELDLVDFLRAHPECTFHEVDSHLCQMHTGLYTPAIEFIRICMESYTTKSTVENPRWFLRFEDTASERRVDIENAENIIINLGKRLGFTSGYNSTKQSTRYVSLYDLSSNLEYRFFISSTAAISNIVLYGDQPPNRAYIIVPGSRSNILFYKLRRDPRLGKAFNPTAGSWRFLKFRHLRSLSETPMLNRDNFEQLLGLDPLTYSAPQLWLI